MPDHGLRRQGARLLRRVHGRRPARAARHELAPRGAARRRLPRHRHARRRDLPARRGRAVAVRQGGRRAPAPTRNWPSSRPSWRSTAATSAWTSPRCSPSRSPSSSRWATGRTGSSTRTSEPGTRADPAAGRRRTGCTARGRVLPPRTRDCEALKGNNLPMTAELLLLERLSDRRPRPALRRGRRAGRSPGASGAPPRRSGAHRTAARLAAGLRRPLLDATRRAVRRREPVRHLRRPARAHGCGPAGDQLCAGAGRPANARAGLRGRAAARPRR